MRSPPGVKYITSVFCSSSSTDDAHAVLFSATLSTLISFITIVLGLSLTVVSEELNVLFVTGLILLTSKVFRQFLTGFNSFSEGHFFIKIFDFCNLLRRLLLRLWSHEWFLINSKESKMLVQDLHSMLPWEWNSFSWEFNKSLLQNFFPQAWQ